MKRILTLMAISLAIACPSMADEASDLLNLSKVQGGIVVHLGCGDGSLTAALRASDAYTVHGLDADAKDAAKARASLLKKGVYGGVSVEQLNGKRLPYADNLINLVVVSDASGVSMDEVTRVLAPEGVACVKRGGKWATTVKARPDNIDDWSHYLHDSGNNAVAADTVVAPPRRMQWIAPPLWLRSHETPSGVQAHVSSGGRVFYIFDEGLIGIVDNRLPERWSIVARDAFNGKLLWKRAINWGWRQWSESEYEGKDLTEMRARRTNVPPENERRLVAVGDRLYATLDYHAPLSILDAATGEVLKTVDETGPVGEILVSDGVAVVRTRQPEADETQRRTAQGAMASEVVAVNAETGDVLWRHNAAGVKSLSLAVDQGRVIFAAGRDLVSINLKTGKQLWRETVKGNVGTLVAHKGSVFIRAGSSIIAHSGATGKLVWRKDKVAGGYSADLFVADSLIWGGSPYVGDDGKPAKKADGALAVGLDLKSGDEKRRVVVPNLRSPEHHHRCYRNFATDRFIITGLEGAEYVDLQGDDHSQNNWIRGACKLGIMPANGLLYVPADQCFCHPGSKLLGMAALAPETASEGIVIADKDRLEKGSAYGKTLKKNYGDRPGDWPTFRADARRTGSTKSTVSERVKENWRAKIGGKLSAPVVAGGTVYIAAVDAHTVYAIDAKSGKTKWTVTAGGRVDSPPTIHNGLLLFGSADGRVYCVRASDGELVWRFMAAPRERRVAYFDQIESAWPVHGSVLVENGVAYVGAGRSTYLEGGIHLTALEPATGKVLHTGVIEGPHPSVDGERDHSFYTTGANSDVLVAEDGVIYMRQKSITTDLKEIPSEILSTKGEHNIGKHVFSTSGLLDDSWYNRTFWMYSKRWPGFQLGNQAPKTGQILVVGEEKTYALRAFYRRNVHSPMFFPGKEGYLVFADRNDNEPQIVGEAGARKPIEWLPQSDYARGRGKAMQTLDKPAFGLDKMIGYTRAEEPEWTTWMPVRVRAMVKAGDKLVVAGPPDEFDANDPYAAFDGRRGGRLAMLSTKDGSKIMDMELDTEPSFDGMIAAGGSLYITLKDGSLMCLTGK